MTQVIHKSILCMLIVMTTMVCATAKESTLQNNSTKITSEQKMWALATTAILTESNKGNHRLLGGSEATPAMRIAWRKSLATWWDIHNREDLIDTLKWIDSGGHRKNFDMLSRVLLTATPDQITEIKARVGDAPEMIHQIDIVLKYGKQFGRKSIIAWDYDRYISICGWGYIAGYLTEDEAWTLIMPVAQSLQYTFDSWEDLGLNHVIGRQFWSLEQSKARGGVTEQADQYLLTDTASPWLTIHWLLDLDSVVD